MGYFNTQDDLESALNPATFVQIFDDGNNGFVEEDNPGVQLVLMRAHAEVLSYLPRIYGTMPAELPDTVSILLKSAELDYATALSYERHPEYVRSFGEEKRSARWQRAEKKMERIAIAIQRIAPNDTPPETAPRNVGGVVYNRGATMICDGSDGSFRGGDF